MTMLLFADCSSGGIAAIQVEFGAKFILRLFKIIVGAAFRSKAFQESLLPMKTRHRQIFATI
jgi:hypothetical protein